MSIEETLSDLLVTLAPTYPTYTKRTTFPFFVYSPISQEQDITLDGTPGMFECVIEVEIHAKTKKQVTDLANAVRALLHGHHDANTQWILFAGGSNILDTYGKDSDIVESHFIIQNYRTASYD